MTLQPLPRSLDPLPLESLTGFLLRLAHRLDLSPARVAALTGLAHPRLAIIPASRLFALEPAMADDFARVSRLSLTEAAALTLVSLADRYPPADPRFSGRHRQTAGIFVKETWVFFRASRYCPECLAGDGSRIQQEHGGAWSLHWRLPIVFACPSHQRLLEHTCPGCGNPAHYRAGHQSSQLVRSVSTSGLHPAQCRIPIRPGHRTEAVRACGTRLDHPTPPAPTAPADKDLLAFQIRLLGLLRPDAPGTVTSVGHAAASRQYLVDLRILACLITASWPAARDLVEPPHRVALLDRHVRRQRCQMSDIRGSGRAVRELSFYDTPPLDAATGAVLLATADRIATTGDLDVVRDLLRPIVAQAPGGMPNWTKQFLAGDGYCSPGLQAALGLEIGNTHVIKRIGIQPPVIVSPPPRPVRFGVDHIPQHLLAEWYEQYFARFTIHVKPRLLRRAAAARLAQICVGGHPADAGRQLGLPRAASVNALTVVRDHLPSRARHAFEAGIEALADQLNTASMRANYGNRRHALAAWSLSTRDWAVMTGDLQQRPEYSKASRWPSSPYLDWGERKRILASTWVWVRITEGEHLFAPAIRPHLDQTRSTQKVDRTIFTRWRFISAEHPQGHWAELRERLDTYADQLTTQIDMLGVTPARR